MASSFYFVNKGLLHLHYKDNSGQQNTIHFALENWLITDYNTFLGNPSTQFSIAALEDVEVMTIHKTQFDKLLLNFPFMAIYFNTIHMKAYAAALQKQKTFATINKEDFYAYFTIYYPEFIKRIPHDILHSYIGISVEELAFFNKRVRS